MCTAVSWLGKHHFFGRNLDLEYAYDERVAVTPRAYPFSFRKASPLPSHYAMIGTATVVNGYPLYYEATNEMGLSMAGLNFPGNAVYHPCTEGRDNIAPFELIPWVLGQCADLDGAERLLQRINIVDIPFSTELPLSPLHWMIADREGCIVAEPLADGLRIYRNPVGVMTNNPTFDFHLHNLTNYMALCPGQPKNRFSNAIELKPYGTGLGAVGLPGDYSSASRFIKAAFVKLNCIGGRSVEEDMVQFFRILQSVQMPRGSVLAHNGEYDITLYSGCCDTDAGIYYYTTYCSGGICAVDMHRENLEGIQVVSYPMRHTPMIEKQN